MFTNEDSFLNQILIRIGEICLLNILFILTSIPIVTIGASFTAMYQCTLKMINGTHSDTARTYFKAFKSNFKQATIAWIAILVITTILLFNLQFSVVVASKAVFYTTVFVTVILILVALYVFPVIATFENTLANLIKNSFIFMIAKFPATAIIALITFFPISLTYMDVALLPLYTFCWCFFAFALVAYINSFIFYKIFAKHLR